MTYQPLFFVKFPAVAAGFNQKLQSIAQFEILPAEMITDSFFFFPESTPFNLNFQVMDFDSIYALANLGSILYFMLLYLALIAMSLMLALIAKAVKRLSKLSNRLSSALYWSGLLRFAMEIYLEVGLCTLLNIQASPDPEGFFAIQLSNYLAYGLLALLIAVPLWIVVFYSCSMRRWNQPQFVEKFGSPLEGMSLDRKDHRWLPLVSPTLFLLRRVLFCLTVIYKPEFLWL